jgi:putative ABC transport system ATP-binding protein
METLKREHGVSLLFSTHDERVMRRARRIVHMRDGRVDQDEARA